MHYISVRVNEPRAADVFAYRGWILVLTFDGELLSYSTTGLSSALVSEHQTRGAIASYALFSSKGIGASAESRSAWKEYDHETAIEVSVGAPRPIRMGTQLESDAMLDMHVYYDRVYVATDKGTWSAGINSARGNLDSLSDQRRHVSAPTESLSVGMGAVGASLGRNGLAILLDAWEPSLARESRVDSESLRCSLGWGQATNYPAENSYEVLEIERKDHRGRPVLDEVRPSERPTVELAEGTYALWEAGRLLVGGRDGVASLGKATPNSRRSQLSDAKTTRRPLWIGVTGNRMIVTESAESLEVGRAGSSITVHRGASGSVRTFPASHRYRRLIASTVEGGFLLTSVLRDSDEDD